MKPVEYSAGSAALVQAYEHRTPETKNGAYWSEQEIATVKKEIKDHYIKIQRRRCAYCQHEIVSDNNAVWDAEHIISKQRAPEFMFEPRNLAIACKDCNLAKLDQEVRINPTRKRFPVTSSDYRIVHPHFDEYEEHIGWLGPICFARSREKGARTISMCNLTRFASMSLGTAGNIMDTRFLGLVGELLTVDSVKDGQAILAGLRFYFSATVESSEDAQDDSVEIGSPD